MARARSRLSAKAVYSGEVSGEEVRQAPHDWRVPIARGIPPLAVGLTITFTADHSSIVGLVMFSIFGLTTAIVLGIAGTRQPASELTRPLYRGLALISGFAAVLAVLAAIATGGSLPLLLLLVGGFAVLAGALELVWGLRHRAVSPLARDAITVGGGTLALAIVLALVADPVSAVGFFGAYAVILGIFLLIAGLSLKWSTPMKEGAAL